jgi:outer membrane protein OmpA-like peptidoglycan-associated protein
MRLSRAALAGAVAAGALLGAATAGTAAEKILTAEQIASQLSGSRSLGKQAKVDLPSVTFDYASAHLTSQAEQQLDELAKALEFPAFKNTPFTVAGHTDARGPADYNQHLSERRADSVRQYLEDRHNFPESRIEAVGYGKSQLLPNLPPTAPDQRRVEISLRQ